MAKPPVVSVPAAVVSSAGVTTLPVTVAGISVAIGQPQKAAGMSTHLLKHNFKFHFFKGRMFVSSNILCGRHFLKTKAVEVKLHYVSKMR